MFQIGEKVKIVGLKSETGKKFNGLVGSIIKPIEEKGRMAVKIVLKNEDGSETKLVKSIKIENLEPSENEKNKTVNKGGGKPVAKIKIKFDNNIAREEPISENLMAEIKAKLIENSNKEEEEDSMISLTNKVLGDNFGLLFENPYVIADVVMDFLKERNHNATKNLLLTLKLAYQDIFVKTIPCIFAKINSLNDQDISDFLMCDNRFAPIWEGVELNFS